MEPEGSLYALLVSPIRAACSAHLILHLMILVKHRGYEGPHCALSPASRITTTTTTTTTTTIFIIFFFFPLTSKYSLTECVFVHGCKFQGVRPTVRFECNEHLFALYFSEPVLCHVRKLCPKISRQCPINSSCSVVSFNVWTFNKSREGAVPVL